MIKWVFFGVRLVDFAEILKKIKQVFFVLFDAFNRCASVSEADDVY